MAERRRFRHEGQERLTSRLKHDQTINDIVSEMTAGPLDPTHQLPRFVAQIKREVFPQLEININDDLFDLIENALSWHEPDD